MPQTHEFQRVLCAAQPIFGHTVPALVLARAFRERGLQVEFVHYGGPVQDLLIQQGFHPRFRVDLGMSPDAQTAAALEVLRQFEPQVTVCDWRYDFWLALRAFRPARSVSILRCEQFLGYRRLSPQLPDKFFHSQVGDLNRVLEGFGQPPLRDRRQLFAADFMVVPSVEALDVPPENRAGNYPRSEFLYSGPLFLEDVRPAPAAATEWIAQRRKRRRPVILATLGSVWGASVYSQLAPYFSSAEFATVLIVPDASLRGSLEPFAGGSLLLLDWVSDLPGLMRKCDAVLHHCGHLTTLLALLAGKPAITLPSGEYDREDNAIRLQRLGCSRHLEAAALADGVELDRVVAELVADSEVRANIASLSGRIRRTMEECGADRVVERVLAKGGETDGRRLQGNEG